MLQTTKILLSLKFSFINLALIVSFNTFILCLLLSFIKGSVVTNSICSSFNKSGIIPGKVAVIIANFPPKSVIYFSPYIK